MSMAILEEILSCLKGKVPYLGDITVDRVCLGWVYTAVQLSTGDVGLCHSLLGEPSPGSSRVIRRSGTLAGSPVTDLTEMIKSWDIGERVIGVATLNALSQIVLKREHEGYGIVEGNALGGIDIRRTDTVGMVGNFKPLLPRIRNKTSNVTVFERSGPLDDGVFPDTACEELLPKADVVVITGTAMANGTMGRLLELSKNARSVAVIGPSASVVPDPLFRRGVDVMGGVIMTNPDKAMQIVAEGGGTPQLKAAARFVTIKAKRDGAG